MERSNSFTLSWTQLRKNCGWYTRSTHFSRRWTITQLPFQKQASGLITWKLDASNQDLFISDGKWQDTKALWDAIELDYASKKAPNWSWPFTRFLSLNCHDSDLWKHTSSFCEITRQMANSGVKIDENLLAHMALNHLPSEHVTTQQVIISTAESSNTDLTASGVLSQPNKLIKDRKLSRTNPNTLKTWSQASWNFPVLYKHCSSGHHNPNIAHPEQDCWQVNPEKHPHSSKKIIFASSASITSRALISLACSGNKSGKRIMETEAFQTMVWDKNKFAECKEPFTNIEVTNGDSMQGVGTDKLL